MAPEKEETKEEKKAAPKAEVKAEPKAEAKAEAKAEPKAEAKAKAKPNAKAKAQDDYLTVILRKSGIGYNIKQKRTLIGLGLTKMNKTKRLKDTAAIRGMINKVSHLVEVLEPDTK